MRRHIINPATAALDVDALLAFHKGTFGDFRMEAPDVTAFLALDETARASHLAGLSGEELGALTTALEAHFASLGTDTDEALDARDATVAAIELCVTENSARVERAAAASERAAAQEARLAEMTQPDEPQPTEPVITNPEDTPPAEEEPTPEAEALAAAAARRDPAPAGRRPTAAALAGRRPATADPRPVEQGSNILSFTLSEGLGSARAGREASWSEIGQASADKFGELEEFSTSGKFAVAHVSWEHLYADERKVSSSFDAEANAHIVREALTLPKMREAAAAFLQTHPSDFDALTAAGGGFCAPFPVDYEIPVNGDISRPVRDALARFGADRGGINFTQPPVLGSTAAGDGVGTWTATQDAAVTLASDGTYGGGATKVIVQYACQPTVTEQIQAITLRQSFANFSARFHKEEVAAHQQLGLVNWARVAETLLLAGIWNRVSFRVNTAKVLGSTADFLAALDGALWQARGRERMARTQPFRCIAPMWLFDMLRADLARSMPTSDYNTKMALAEASIRAWAAARNVNITWAMEDRLGANSYGRAQATNTADGTTTTNSVLNDFPDVVEWYLFPEGAFQFLDGGTLDLGVVRDTRTNAVNQFETFAESFEGIAKRLPYGYAFTSSFEPTGTFAALYSTQALDL